MKMFCKGYSCSTHLLAPHSVYTEPFATPTPRSSISTDRERTMVRNEVLQMYQSEELPSIYSDFGTSLGFSMKDSQNRTMCAKETHSNVVDWEGRDDAANPRNFSKSKKTINIACIFFMSFVSCVRGLFLYMFMAANVQQAVHLHCSRACYSRHHARFRIDRRVSFRLRIKYLRLRIRFRTTAHQSPF